MREVRDRSGRRYVLLKRSQESSLVIDETGSKTYLPNASLLLPEDGPDLITYIAEQGPVSVRKLLDETTFCESDLHGQLTELRAGKLIEEVVVYGERGYELSEHGASLLDQS